MSLMVSASGIRGLVGQTMTREVAGAYAAALGTFVNSGLVVLGRDTRPSGAELRDAAVAALTGCGCRVIDLGVASTPGTALMVRIHQAAGGLMITASHNPAPWNGLKFLTGQGAAPPTDQARLIWDIRDARRFQYVPEERRGHVVEERSTDEKHVAEVLKIVQPEAISSRRFKVVLDSINGAGSREGRLLLESLGVQLIHLNADPDGQFAHAPEPIEENLTGLCHAVRKEKADIGFAQDPDADRLAIVDQTGCYIGEEYTLALAAMRVLASHPGPVATNLSTSRMIDDIAGRAGCRVHRTAVGEANVVEAMQKHGCVLGGEGNGGVIDPRVVPVRDSLVAMSHVLQLLADRRKLLSKIVAELPRYVMIKKKFDCPRDRIETITAGVRDRWSGQQLNDQDGIRVDWPEGWVHVRASNTEPIVRVIAEAADRAAADSLVGRVMDIAGPLLT